MPTFSTAKYDERDAAEDELQGLKDDDDLSSLDSVPVAAGGISRTMLRHRRGIGAATHVTAAFALVLLALGWHMYMKLHQAEALVWNPLAHTWSASLLAWTLIFGGLCTSMPSVFVWVEENNIKGGSDTPVSNIRLLEVIFTAAVLVIFLISPCASCVLGPGTSSPNKCLCDRVVSTGTPRFSSKVPPDMTIAFVGDSAIADGDEVLQLLRAERVSAVVFNGDAAYLQSSTFWIEKFEKHLGSTPFYVAGGVRGQPHRTKQPSGMMGPSHQVTECRGELGIQNMCTHQGLGLLLSGTGYSNGESCGGGRAWTAREQFFERALTEFGEEDVQWPICVFDFHSNEHQAGGVRGVGWENYDLCLKRGALIISSHRRPFVRTPEIDLVTSQNPHVHVSRQVGANSGPDQAALLNSGQSMIVFTGHGAPVFTGNFSAAAVGDDSRKPRKSHLASAAGAIAASIQEMPASTMAEPSGTARPGEGEIPTQSPQSIQNGAFFCTFHVHGDPHLAHCFFKDTFGRVADDFFLRRPDVAGGIKDHSAAFV